MISKRKRTRGSVGYNRFPRTSRKPLRAVSIARTVEAPQQHFEKFLYKAGQDLGRLADIRTITSTRMTFLESRGIRKAMRRAHIDPRSCNTFAYSLSHSLDAYRAQEVDVSINPDQPMKIMGTHKNVLALNILDEVTVRPDGSKEYLLLGQHNKSMELVEQEYGALPNMKVFDPHISIGEIAIGSLTEDQIEHPELLLSDEGRALIPETIALNGLQVFLDGKCLKQR